MAAPAWATNLTTFWLEGATTVTAIGTGGAALGNPETDFFIQGTNCISKGAWTNATKGFIIDRVGTTFTIPSNGAIIFYAKYDAQGSLDTKANGGFRFIVGNSSGDYFHYYIGGKDTLAFDSWYPYVIDSNTATSDNSTGIPSGAERWVGVLATLPTTSGPTKGNPIAMDAIRYGRCDIEYTFGQALGGYNTFDRAEAYANDASRRWGLIQLQEGAYQIQGFHSFGTGSSLVDFRDSNKVLFWRDCDNNVANNSVSTQFNRIEVLNASSNVDWDNIIIQALGTRARGVFVHSAGTFDATSCQFVDMDTFSLLSTSVMTDCIFRRTNAITASGSTLNGSQIIEPSVATNTSGLIWDKTAANPDGLLDGMTFTMGANSHHAIEFGNLVPASMTLRNCDFSGFSASLNNNASIFHFKDTTGTITLNLVGCTSDVAFANSYRTDGATIVIVEDPVTTEITVRDNDTGAVIQNARVRLTVKDGANFPYNVPPSALTSSGTTATVTHLGHGLSTNDNIQVSGCNEERYNGNFNITVTGSNTYTYTMTASTTSPATGSPKVTFAYFNDLTSVSGTVSDTRSRGAAQAVEGWVRKGSTSPLYKEQRIDETISTTTGLTLNIRLVKDE